MGEERKPQKVKLFFGLIFSDRQILAAAEKRLSHDYGEIDSRSPVVFFDKTSYYEKEMGPGLLRQYISIKPLMDIGDLPSVKSQTNILEKLFSDPRGNRQINIDPGYLVFSKVVLATTKDYNHRLYIGDNMYAEVTLHFKGEAKSFVPWEWTYPDYRDPMAVDFFNNLRSMYKEQLRKDS